MKKITGAYRKMLGQVEFHEQKLPLNNPGAFMPAVIVVGERNDEVPKAFTESEVKAMASEIVEAAMAECNTVYHTDEDAEAEMSAMIRRILERHGVVLDPA